MLNDITIIFTEIILKPNINARNLKFSLRTFNSPFMVNKCGSRVFKKFFNMWLTVQSRVTSVKSCSISIGATVQCDLIYMHELQALGQAK